MRPLLVAALTAPILLLSPALCAEHEQAAATLAEVLRSLDCSRLGESAKAWGALSEGAASSPLAKEVADYFAACVQVSSRIGSGGLLTGDMNRTMDLQRSLNTVRDVMSAAPRSDGTLLLSAVDRGAMKTAVSHIQDFQFWMEQQNFPRSVLDSARTVEPATATPDQRQALEHLRRWRTDRFPEPTP